MVDQLRVLLNRPLRDGDRPRLFAIAVALIAGVATVLTLLDETGRAPRAPRMDAPSPAPEWAAGPAESGRPITTAAAPSEEGAPPAGAEPSREDIAHAKRAGRRFLAGYLPYTYGRGRARRIVSTTGELRDRLASERPRVPLASVDAGHALSCSRATASAASAPGSSRSCAMASAATRCGSSSDAR